MECTITTPEELVFEGSVTSVVVPAADGEMGFLPRHAPLVGTLGHGELRVKESGGQQKAGGSGRRFFVCGGFVQVVDDKVTVLAVEAAPVESLDAAASSAAVEELRNAPPASGSSVEDRDEYSKRVAIAKARARLASS